MRLLSKEEVEYVSGTGVVTVLFTIGMVAGALFGAPVKVYAPSR